MPTTEPYLAVVWATDMRPAISFSFSIKPKGFPNCKKIRKYSIVDCFSFTDHDSSNSIKRIEVKPFCHISHSNVTSKGIYFPQENRHRLIDLIFNVNESPKLVYRENLAPSPSVVVVILSGEEAGFYICHVKALVPR